LTRFYLLHKPFQTPADVLMHPSSGVFRPKTLDKREELAPAQLALSQFLHGVSDGDRLRTLVRKRLHLFEVFFLLAFRFTCFHTLATVNFLFWRWRFTVFTVLRNVLHTEWAHP
jgi:hypothetical protein